MPRRGIRRFALEIVFLAGVAAALTVADLRTEVVIAVMALAWVVVALLEWAAWLDEPHYGRGLPPRYYVPHVALPPPRPVEQYRGGGYPVLAPDESPTFVASTHQWAVALDDWPVVEGEETVIASPEDAERSVVLPPPIAELEQTIAADQAVAKRHEEPQHDALVAAAAAAAAVERVPAREHHQEPELEQMHAPVELVHEPRPRLTVGHHVDPLAATGRRRFRLRRGEEDDAIEVIDGPAPDRTLPLRLRGETEANVR